MAGPIDFNYFLARKYALQQQDADASTQNAGTNAVTGAAQANNLNSDAALTAVKTRIAPAEARSSIALQGAQAALLGEQAAVVAPTTAANIAAANQATIGQRIANRTSILENLIPTTDANGLPYSNTARSAGITGALAPGGVIGGPALPTVETPLTRLRRTVAPASPFGVSVHRAGFDF